MCGSSDDTTTTTSSTTMTKIDKRKTKRRQQGHLSSRMARHIRARASQLSFSDELHHTLRTMHETLFSSPIPSGRLTSVSRSRLHKLLVYAFLSAWYDDFSRDPLACLESGEDAQEEEAHDDDHDDHDEVEDFEACFRPTLRLMIQRVALEIGHMKYAAPPQEEDAVALLD